MFRLPFVSRKKYDELEHIDRCIEDSEVERLWERNLALLKSGGFGEYTVAEECPKTLLRYWKAQAEAGYPNAIDNVRYFEEIIRKDSENGT